MYENKVKMSLLWKNLAKRFPESPMRTKSSRCLKKNKVYFPSTATFLNDVGPEIGTVFCIFNAKYYWK